MILKESMYAYSTEAEGKEFIVFSERIKNDKYGNPRYDLAIIEKPRPSEILIGKHIFKCRITSYETQWNIAKIGAIHYTKSLKGE